MDLKYVTSFKMINAVKEGEMTCSRNSGVGDSPAERMVKVK